MIVKKVIIMVVNKAGVNKAGVNKLAITIIK